MLIKLSQNALAACLLLCISGTVFADSEIEPTPDKVAVTSEQQTETEQVAVIILTDPEIAAVEEEEPDCE